MNDWDHERQTYQGDWYDDFANVLALGAWLVEDGIDAENLQYYYSKPWHYTSEWKEMQTEKEDSNV